MGVIYCLQSPSGKVYVGRTVSTFTQRMRVHKCESKRKDFPLYRAAKKYGWNSFSHSILSEGVELSRLHNLEKIWVILLEAQSMGYNQTAGGEGTAGYKHSESQRRNMRLAKVGEKRRPMSPETKFKISQKLKGNRNGVGKARICTPAHRFNLRLAHLGQTPWNKGVSRG